MSATGSIARLDRVVHTDSPHIIRRHSGAVNEECVSEGDSTNRRTDKHRDRVYDVFQ